MRPSMRSTWRSTAPQPRGSGRVRRGKTAGPKLATRSSPGPTHPANCGRPPPGTRRTDPSADRRRREPYPKGDTARRRRRTIAQRGSPSSAGCCGTCWIGSPDTLAMFRPDQSGREPPDALGDREAGRSHGQRSAPAVGFIVRPPQVQDVPIPLGRLDVPSPASRVADASGPMGP